MNRLIFLSIFFVSLHATAQTIYVDAVKGRDDAKGTITDPFNSLEKAATLASSFSGKEPVIVRVHPGIYVLEHQIEIKTANVQNDTARYTIEAVDLPDDPNWAPSSMPVIQSVSPDNNTTQFTHTVGILAAKSNVSIRGLKFVGNGNPSVRYYYPVSRDNETLNKLEISQCYFVGERNSSPIQGAIFAHGAGLSVDHCVFYECKNAFLFFKAIKNCSITNNIVYGAYEAAAWYGGTDTDLTFRNNIISHCNFFWNRPENTFPTYTFSNSIITDVTSYMGFYTPRGLEPAEKNSHMEKDIKRTGKLVFSEVKTQGLPKDYLHLTAQSDGAALKAGVFKK